MRIFYKDVDEEITPDDFETLRSGNWLAKPRRGIFYDAHDAQILRHYNGGDMKKSTAGIVMDRLVTTITFILIAVIMIAGVWFLTNKTNLVKQEAPVVLELTVQDGRTFICEHYPDGAQICVDQDDPDVGGGKLP